MRKPLIIAVLVLASSTAFGASLSKQSRDDWRSIDACIRHLEREGATAIPKVLEHLKPMRKRRDTIFLKRIRLGGQEETDLVGRQWTRAGESKDRGAIAKTIVGTILRYVWNFALDVVDAVLPGCAFLLPVVLVMYAYIRWGRKVLRAMYADAERLPAGMRKEVFTSPVVVSDFEREKRRRQNEQKAKKKKKGEL